MITIDKLKKNFGEKIAVDIEHYEINQGDMLGLVGNNGAGKTTMMNMISGIYTPDAGIVFEDDCQRRYIQNVDYNLQPLFEQEELARELAKEEHLWMTVPKAVAFKYIKEEANREKMRRLLKEKKMVNPVFKRGDFKPRRYLAMVKNHLRQFGNFKKYYS